MGFERVMYKLEFDDPRWAGLEIRARGATFEQAMELQRIMGLGIDLLKRDDPIAEEDRRRYYALLAEIIVDWNRTDGGVPVPVDEKNMALEELPMLQSMTRAYLRATFEVPPPLSRPSSDGEPSEELFQLMEPLSENPGS